MLRRRRVEEQPRVLRRPGGEHDDARRLHVALSCCVVVLDTGRLRSLCVGQHARDGRARAHFGARATRFAQVRDDRVAERSRGATDVAPAVVNAGRAALVFGRVHADARRHEPDAVLGAGFDPHLAMPEGLHRWHRIGLARRPPRLFRLRIPRDADVLSHLVVIAREVLVGNRPVEPPVVLALHLEIGRQQAREVGEVMQRRAAHAPARLVAVAERVLSFEQKRRTRRLDAPAPEVGAHEIGELPVGPGFEHRDLLARRCERRGEHRAGGAGAHDHYIDFFAGRHVTTSSAA